MAFSTRLTYEQSLELPENKFEEIVDGEIRLMPPPSRVHALLIERLLRSWALATDGFRQAPADIATATPLNLPTAKVDLNEIWKLLPAGS
jgi:hypothetical protein